MTEIVLLRGPLGDEWVSEVARLYGSHDPRYSEEAFCRYQFNENPYGFSLHAFARVDEEFVGHCAVIPVATRVAGELRMTGKTESLFVRPEHRGRTGGGASLAETMVSRLYAFSDTEGFSDIHSLGRPEFAKVHAAGGARVFEFQRRQFAFFLRPEAVTALLGDRVGAEEAGAIFERQQARLQETHIQIERSPGECREIGAGELDQLDVAAFTELAPQGNRWTVPPTEESADWYLGSSGLRRMRASSGKERFDCVYTVLGPATWLEIFDWRCGEDGAGAAERAVCRLIEDGKREGRDLVCFFDWSTYNPSAGVLRGVGERLGFESVERPRLIYVRSEDPAFMDIERMTFSPYLYAAF